MSKRNKCILIIIVAIICSILSVFLFAIGWDELKTNVGLSRITIIVAIICLILSLFLFAIGWDKLKDYLESGSVSGVINLPKVPIKYNPTIYLVEPSVNKKIFRVRPNSSGWFSIRDLTPGKYNLIIDDAYISKVTKEIVITTKSNTNIVTINLEFTSEKIMSKVGSPSFFIKNTHVDTKNLIWILGHDKGGYKIYYNSINDEQWKEKIIPFFKGANSAIFCCDFSDNIFIVGSAGKGAVISNDNGLTWLRFNVPNKINYIDNGLELSDGNWMVMGKEQEGNGNGDGVLLLSSDKGVSWKTLLRDNYTFSTVLKHSSGRLLVSTEGIKDSSVIYHSDDNGITWSKSKLNDTVNLRGIISLYELRNGYILAGTMSGTIWKGDFYKSCKLLISKDSGLTWDTLYDDPDIWEITNIYESKNGVIYIWGHDRILFSFDKGNVWNVFYKQNCIFSRGYAIKDNWIYFSSTEVFKININDLEIMEKSRVLVK